MQWQVTDDASPHGRLVLLAGATETGMVQVYVPGEFVWITPDCAIRMSRTIAFAANVSRGQG